VNICLGKHIFVIQMEGGTLDVQEENGHNSSFGLGTDHDSILESAEEE
jgi:hypothetical protein